MTTKIQKPLIGITLDYRQSGDYSAYPWFALSHRYVCAVEEAGGIPLLLAPTPATLEAVDHLHGIIFTGGDFDIDPARYGVSMCHPKVKINAHRTNSEMALFEKVFTKRIPILGICGGHQLMNVALGGSLNQHIEDDIANSLVHESNTAHPKGAQRHEPSHKIKIAPDSKLFNILQVTETAVNSSHHQCIKELGKGIIATAWAEDGIIEAIEVVDHPFCLGVQWHPEYHVSPQDPSIFKAFLKATQVTQGA